nr:MAG TPA: hypothetical protein [Caudoviricetes sp.]
MQISEYLNKPQARHRSDAPAAVDMTLRKDGVTPRKDGELGMQTARAVEAA